MLNFSKLKIQNGVESHHFLPRFGAVPVPAPVPTLALVLMLASACA